jgi:secreted trypsin-like serine protease
MQPGAAMKRCIALLSCVFLLHCGGTSTDSERWGEQTEAIVNGQPCGPTDAPTAVAVIATINTQTAQGVGEQVTVLLCTGTLIAPDTVISAAHCVDQSLIGQALGVTVTGLQYYVSQQADLTALAEGSNTLPSDAVSVSSYIGYPGFNVPSSGSGLQNDEDVSLLFLSEANSTVVPEILISAEEASQVVAQAAVIIAGWGQTTGVIGSGPATGYTCHGDSGGPAYMSISTTTPIKRRLIGITSHAYDSSSACDEGAVDTRVDAYLSWINATMTQACSTQARVWCDVPGIIPATYYQTSGSINTTSSTSTVSGNAQGTVGNYVAPKQGCGSSSGDLLALTSLALAFTQRRFRYLRSSP